jgi:hypothetical protein
LATADVTRRRRLLAAGGALALVALVAVLLWPVGVLTGGDDGGDDGGGDQAAATGTPTELGQVVLRPPAGAPSGPTGRAIIWGQGPDRAVQLVARKLEPSTKEFAYQVWVYNDRGDAKSLGAQVTDKNGNFQGAGVLPEDFEDFKYIDLSREPIGEDGGHSGKSVLRGTIPELSASDGN